MCYVPQNQILKAYNLNNHVSDIDTIATYNLYDKDYYIINGVKIDSTIIKIIHDEYDGYNIRKKRCEIVEDLSDKHLTYYSVDKELKKYKVFYDFCKKYNWNDQKIKEVVEHIRKSNINDIKDIYTINEVVASYFQSYRDMIDIAELYAEKVLHIDRSREARKLVQEDFYKIVEHVYKLETDEEIIDYLSKTDLPISKLNKFKKYYIKSFIYLFEFYYEINDVISKFERNIPIVIELKQKNKTKKEKNNIDLAREYICMYVDGNYTSLKQFCEMKNIDQTLMKKYIKIVSVNDLELYKKLLSKLNIQNKQRFNIIKNKIDYMLELIQNGVIDENGNVQKFELLDYYLYVKIPFEQLGHIISSLCFTKGQLYVLRKFIRKYSEQREIMEQTIYNERLIFSINDEPYEVTHQDKIDAINFLRENNIPLYYANYHSAVKRLIMRNLKKVSKQK